MLYRQVALSVNAVCKINARMRIKFLATETCVHCSKHKLELQAWLQWMLRTLLNKIGNWLTR